MNTKGTLSKRNTPLVWAFLLFCSLYFLPSLAMPYVWMRVNSIHIQERTQLLDPIYMDVDREIHKSFFGSFTVTVRSSDGQFICQGHPAAPFDYREDATLPPQLDLTWWLGGTGQMTNCLANGFGVGTFTTTTCHSVLLESWSIPIARNCIESNPFTITDGFDYDFN